MDTVDVADMLGKNLALNIGNKDSKQTKYRSNFGTVRIPGIRDLENADITVVRKVTICTSSDHMPFR